MAGMCRYSGKRLDGWPRIAQSLQVIFTTRIGTRLQRRDFGSSAPELQDRPAIPETLLDHFVSIAEAIDKFEPAVELRGFRLISADETGTGTIAVDLIEVATGITRQVDYEGMA